MEWIDINVDLPPQLELVLGYDTQRIHICFQPLEDEYNEHWTIQKDLWGESCGCTGAITHWMPLPLLPMN